VIVGFRHKGLRMLFETGSVRGVQPAHERRLWLILARLHAAVGSDDMNLPGLRLHALSGDRKGHCAVTVSANWRVTFRFERQDVTDVDYLDYH
jgi:proteic killer suppression protein